MSCGERVVVVGVDVGVGVGVGRMERAEAVGWAGLRNEEADAGRTWTLLMAVLQCVSSV